MVYVTSDPHGHRDKLVAALRDEGLIDAYENWSGGTAQLWFLGDLLDRGPDGIGVIHLVRRLVDQAPVTGGHVGLLLGNHEIIALGMHRFARGTVDDQRVLGWIVCWQRNGGHVSDQIELTDELAEWIASCPVMVDIDGHLLMHCDTTEYLQYGETIDGINAAVARVLGEDDIDDWWVLLERMNERFDFAGEDGTETAEAMMGVLGVRRIVHGHTIIGDLLGIERHKVRNPLLYANTRVLAVDGGIYGGGPCLVVSLDGWPEPE